ncbi:MAG TPA: type II secretion system F family protein [Acidobacteriota bacterium]|nr:type II secretion system F family protein [Acidobacteriota bacterium]
MPLFDYKAVTPDGKIVEGSLQAPSEREAMIKLAEQGQTPVSVLTSGASKGLLSRELHLPWQIGGVSRKELLIFTQELSTLVKAGLPLDRSLNLLAELTENEQLSEIIRQALREIKSGKSLSDALGDHPQVFPRIYVNMVKAGELGGVLDQILERLVEYLESAQELREYLRSALIYPAILTFVSLASVVIMLTFVIPRFADVFESASMPVPMPMQIMLGFSGFITGYWWLILLAMAAIWYFFQRYISSPEGRLSWDSALLRVPMLGPLLQKLEVSRFARTLGTLLKSAVPLIQSINIVKEVISNRRIADAMEPMKSGVKKGEGLAKPFRETAVFPPFAVHLLEVGEETGRLDAMLLQIADAYDRELKTSMKNLLALVEPAIILFMGLVIGIMVVSMLYSIFSINNVAI